MVKTKRIIWGTKTYEFYKPQRNKIKLSLIGAFIIACLITPATNWLMIPTFKFLNKSIWLYQ